MVDPYPTTREEIVASYHSPLRRLWLRVLARLMEWLTDVQPKQLNYSEVTPQLAVGGAFRNRQIKRLKQRGVTAVVDCRLEARDDAQALADAGIQFLHVPTPDRYGFTFGQIFLIRPSGPIKNVTRCVPRYVRPMKLFSPQTP